MAAEDDAHPLTPYLCVDREQLDRNLAAMQARCDAAGVRLRPHAKGHRSAWIAARQVQFGASGIAVATAAEAECMLRAGISDVLITSALAPGAAATAAKAARLGDVTVVAGSEDGVRLLAQAAARAAVTLPVLVDVDVGQHRGGAGDSEAAVRIAGAVSESDELTLAGVQAYEGHLQAITDAGERTRRHGEAMAALSVILDAMSKQGFACPVGHERGYRYVNGCAHVGRRDRDPTRLVCADGLRIPSERRPDLQACGARRHVSDRSPRRR